MTVTSLTVAADHPAYAGHFPGIPVLPGVVLLDATLHAVELASNRPSQRWQVAAAKFQSAVRPGEALTLEHQPLPNGSIRFSIRTADRPVAHGVLVPSLSPAGQAHGEQA